MRTRVLTMIALWSLIGACLGLGGLLGGQILLLLVALGTLWELANLLRRAGFNVNPAALLFALALGLGGHLWGFASVGTSLGLIVLMAAHWQASPAALSAALGAVLLVGIGLGSLNALATLPHPMALWWMIWGVATIKLSDAGAYLMGSQLGRRAWVPKISPGKTVAGFYGALLSGLIMGVLGEPLFMTPWLGPVLGVALAFVGCIGDLLESALKRHTGVKDSGRLLPGIGGLLDLTDSLLLAMPLAYWVIRYGG